jgi:hypothetical protein
MFLLFLCCSDYDLLKDTVVPNGDTGVEIPEQQSCEQWPWQTSKEALVNEECQRQPEEIIGSFDPVIEWQFSGNPTYPGYDQIMAAPAVGNLNDDNADGIIDENDIPDIVYTAFQGNSYNNSGPLTAISGDGSGILWSVMDPNGAIIQGTGGVAIGDLENDGAPEVCVAGMNYSLICVNGQTGALKWAAGENPFTNGAAAFADLDQDGTSEVVFGNQIFDHDGTILGIGGGGHGYYESLAIDWNGDGFLDIIAGNTIYDMAGNTIWSDAYNDGQVAIGDFDLDGRPDIVRTNSGVVRLIDNDGNLVWETSLPGGGTGGAPTVADFDGDGLPEVGVAALSQYSVIDTDGSVLWSRTVSDYSSSVTGSAVFDFEGDGSAEVVYSDEHTLWIFAGATGDIRMEQTGHASGTLREYPLIADVDNDGATEIIVVSNNYAFSGWTGVTVIGDLNNSWAPARPIWNQYGYHITNVNNDGSIPAQQDSNWLTWNNFRAGGSEIGPASGQGDLYIDSLEICDLTCDDRKISFTVGVGNKGLIPVENPVLRVFNYAGTQIYEQTIPIILSGMVLFSDPIELYEDQWGTGVSFTIDPDNLIDECDDLNNSWWESNWPCSSTE